MALWRAEQLKISNMTLSQQSLSVILIFLHDYVPKGKNPADSCLVTRPDIGVFYVKLYIKF